MHIHLIEDNTAKCETILNFIREFDPKIELSFSSSVGSGIRYLVINKRNIDLILLDMSMPSYDNEDETTYIVEHENFGGKEILSQMKARKINIPVIVITMFSSIDDISISSIEIDLNKNYSTIFKGIVFYSSKDSSWTNELVKHVKELSNG